MEDKVELKSARKTAAKERNDGITTWQISVKETVEMKLEERVSATLQALSQAASATW